MSRFRYGRRDGLRHLRLVTWLCTPHLACMAKHPNRHQMEHSCDRIGNTKCVKMVTGDHKTVVTNPNALHLCFMLSSKHIHCALNNQSSACIQVHNLDMPFLPVMQRMPLHTPHHQKTPAFVQIDNVHADWHEWKFGGESRHESN